MPDVEITIPEEKWLWHDLIAEGTLNLVIALQKVGKSSLMGAFLGALTCGLTDYLGKDIPGEKRPLIIVGTDQPASDWAEILVAVGLAKRTGAKGVKWLQPIVRLWHRGNPIHLTEEGIETIYSVAKDHPNAIVYMKGSYEERQILDYLKQIFKDYSLRTKECSINQESNIHGVFRQEYFKELNFLCEE